MCAGVGAVREVLGGDRPTESDEEWVEADPGHARW